MQSNTMKSIFLRHLRSYAPTLIADQRNFKSKYLQNGEENWTKSISISLYLLQYHVIFYLYWFNL